MADIFKILGSISDKTKIEFSSKDYVPFMVNRFLSSSVDCLYFANEMNKYPSLDKEIQFMYLSTGIRKCRRRFSFKKSVDDERISLIMKFLGYNRKNALAVSELFTDQQLQTLSERFSNESK